MGEDLLYSVETDAGRGKQRMADAELDASDDVEFVLLHELVYRGNGACRAVLERKDSVAAESASDSLEYAVEAVYIHDLGILEHTVAGELGVRALGSLARDDRALGEELFRALKALLYFGGEL